MLSNNRTGLVELEIGFLTANSSSQSDIENYVTSGNIDFPLTLSMDGQKQTSPEGILTLKDIYEKQHARDWFVWSQHKE